MEGLENQGLPDEILIQVPENQLKAIIGQNKEIKADIKKAVECLKVFGNMFDSSSPGKMMASIMKLMNNKESLEEQLKPFNELIQKYG